MSDLSNEFHSIEKDVEAFFIKELAKIESGAKTFLADAKTVLSSVVDQAGPVIIAAAAASVQAALGTATGGLSAIAAAAEGAAVGLLKNQGISLAEAAYTQLRTLVLAHVLKSASGPYSAPTAVTLPAAPVAAPAP